MAGGAREGDSKDVVGMGIDFFLTAFSQEFRDIGPSRGLDASIPNAIHERLECLPPRRILGDRSVGEERRGLVSQTHGILPIVAKLLGMRPEHGDLVMDRELALQGLDLATEI